MAGLGTIASRTVVSENSKTRVISFRSSAFRWPPSCDAVIEGLVKELQRERDQKRHLLGQLERSGFRRQLAKDDVKEGDDRKGNGERDRMQHRARRDEGKPGHLAYPGQRRLDEVRDGRLTYPTKPERRERDAQLRRRDIGVQIVEHVGQAAGRFAAGSRHGLDPRFADGDERELRSDKKAVGKNEKDDQEKLEGGFAERGRLCCYFGLGQEQKET
jgi:hypothetical protein